MPKYNGITDKTYERFVIDAGEVRLGYVDESERGTNLGATRGGSTFTVEQELRDMPVDGAKGPVKGGKRLTKVTASMEVNFIEFSPALIARALPGATTESVQQATYIEIKRALQVALTDYADSIALIGEVSGSQRPFIGILQDVLADGNFEISAQDNDESALKIKFVAHFDPDHMDAEPWVIRFPQDVL
jgi:hypothetical protein